MRRTVASGVLGLFRGDYVTTHITSRIHHISYITHQNHHYHFDTLHLLKIRSGPVCPSERHFVCNAIMSIDRWVFIFAD